MRRLLLFSLVGVCLCQRRGSPAPPTAGGGTGNIPSVTLSLSAEVADAEVTETKAVAVVATDVPALPATLVPRGDQNDTDAPTTGVPRTAVPVVATATPPSSNVPNGTYAPEALTQGKAVLIKVRVLFRTLLRGELAGPLLRAIAEYANATRRVMAVKAIVILYVCPVALFVDELFPADVSGVEGCVSGAAMADARTGDVLQSPEQERAYVLWDVLPTDGASLDAARNSAYNAMLNAPDSPALSALFPDPDFVPEMRATSLTAVPPYAQTSTAAPEDDDSIDPWFAIAIACLIILFCCSLVAVVCVIKRRRNAHTTGGVVYQAKETDRADDMWDNADAPVAGRLAQQASVDERIPHSQAGVQQEHSLRGKQQQQQQQPLQPLAEVGATATATATARHSAAASYSYYTDAYQLSSVDLSSSAEQARWTPSPADHVEARYGDDWFPAQVVERQRDGRFTVNWTDGTCSKDIPASDMRQKT